MLLHGGVRGGHLILNKWHHTLDTSCSGLCVGKVVLSFLPFVFFPLSSTLSLFVLCYICLQSKMFTVCYFGLSTSTRPLTAGTKNDHVPSWKNKFTDKDEMCLEDTLGKTACACLSLKLYTLGLTVWNVETQAAQLCVQPICYQLRKFLNERSMFDLEVILDRTCFGRDMAVTHYAELSHFISVETITHSL